MSIGKFKKAYVNLGIKHQLPFQAQAWWLDAVCGPEGWDVALAFDDEHTPIGAMPFGKDRWKGLPILRMPPFTAYFPIWLRDMGSARIVRQYHWTHKALKDLIGQMPGRWWIDQQYEPAFTNGLPFYGKGYKVLTRYTYHLDPLDPVDGLWKGMESATRNLIRKAKSQTRIQTGENTEQLYGLIRDSYRRRGQKAPFSLESLLSIDAELASRDMRTIYTATDAQGALHAACYIVWDKDKAYGLLNGAHPDYRQSGALYRVLWQAIKDASKRGLTFDFEGSVLPQIERVFRSFGAKRVPYLRVVRYQNRFVEALVTLLGKTH